MVQAVHEALAQTQNPFQGYAQQPDGLQNFLSNTPKAVLLAAVLASVGASGLLGFLAGSQAPGVNLYFFHLSMPECHLTSKDTCAFLSRHMH